MNSVIFLNALDTNTVTDTLRNSHCIICGTTYNQKEKIFHSENIACIDIPLNIL